MFTKFIMLAPIGFDLLNGILCPGLSFSFPPLFSTVSPYACSYLECEYLIEVITDRMNIFCILPRMNWLDSQLN